VKEQRITILANQALPVADPKVKGHFGGLETSAWLTAKGLAKIAGLKVTLLTRHHSPRTTKSIEDVAVTSRWSPVEIMRESLDGKLSVVAKFPWINIHRWENSLLYKIPILGFFKLIRRSPNREELETDPFYRKLSTDVCALFGVNAVSARAIFSLKERGVRTVLLVRSNAELRETILTHPDERNEYGELGRICQYAIESADDVVVQTTQQQGWLKSRFGREGFLLGNPFDFTTWNDALKQTTALPASIGVPESYAPYMLWVGRPDRFHKRPLEFMEAARACPEIRFLMILNRGDEALYDQVAKQRPKNVLIVDHVPFKQMPAIFKHAAAFVLTGTVEHEGLPNVVLQAAASGVPVLGLDYAPQQFVEANAAEVSGSLENLIQRMKSIWENPKQGLEIGERGRSLMKSSGSLQEYSERLAAILCPSFESN